VYRLPSLKVGLFITLPTFHEKIKPGTIAVYFATSDVAAAHKELDGEGVRVNEIKDDLYCPDSGVKWFHLEDPDGFHNHHVHPVNNCLK